MTVLTNQQIEDLEQNHEWQTRGDKCPTCLGTGSYKYLGETFECELDEYGRHVQHQLFKLYCANNIPLEMQKLDWAEYPYPEPKEKIDKYIEHFSTIRMSGMGWEIYGKQKGVGKTWAATGILKGLVKEGYKCWFAQFADVKSYYELSDPYRRSFLIGKLRNSEVLVLDEILEPYSSDAQRSFYETQLEEVIRARTISNFPTIITTNLVEEDMNKYYPRVYSLLSAKQFRVELTGDDYRIRQAYWDNESLALNGEVKPIV